MKRPIVTSKEQLSIVCDKITDREFAKIVRQDLVDTASAHDNCAGLAANQIGYNVRMFVVKEKDGYLAFMNPGIGKVSGGMKSDYEGCLSRPGCEPIRKRRHKNAVILHVDIDTGELTSKPFSGFKARVVQHELDHLNGILI